jgi:hypothetical protein
MKAILIPTNAMDIHQDMIAHAFENAIGRGPAR